MKHGMEKRAALGKQSTYLKSLKRKRSNFSFFRHSKRHVDDYPNSTKVGAGKITIARRNIDQGTLRRRDHRSKRMVGHGYYFKANENERFNVLAN